MAPYNNSSHNFDDTDYSKLNFSDLEPIWGMKPIGEVVAKASTLGLVVLCSLIANSIVIFVVVRTKKLQTPTNLFIVNVAVADLLTSCYTPWTVLVYDIFQRWELGPVLCRADAFIEISCLLASVFSLTAVSCDRLLGIVYPFRRRLNKKSARIIIMLVWLAAMIIASPPIFFREYKVRQWADYTEIYCKENTNRLDLYWLILTSLMIWLPLGVMTIAYTIIILKLQRYKKIVTVVGNQKIFQHRRRSKVIKMLFLILISFGACWFPFLAMVFYRSILLSADDRLKLPKTYSIVFFAAHYIALCSCVINPIIYSLTNQKFRTAFREQWICGRDKKQAKSTIKLIYNPTPKIS